ncbi:MAG: sigma-54-dependent Fis family transcriptional regulator [Acidobacteria bacterium]|nr:sigma-54-dependent Fis family transcriptional regulator [Acidobacteriota bacterium]
MARIEVPRLLAIDDEPQSLELIKDVLAGLGLEIHTASDPRIGFELFKRVRPQIVLLDFMMPEINGFEMLEWISAADPGAEVILITAHYSTESAVEAIQKGACDYFNKPLSVEKLRRRISQLLSEAENRRKTHELDEQLLNACQFQGIVGRSPHMLDVFAKIRRVGPHFRNILVTGSTGTGKELVARALHRLSPSAAGTFAVCNCSAIMETLIESELFGYVRGAFTGAVQHKIGLFEYADGGTVFLDEIGELPLTAQSKLLRVLQNSEIQRVGSPVARAVDVRVIAATNRDLRSLVSEGKFREDLYYRLAMVEIALPGLADRREDMPLLQRHFLEKFAALYKKPVTGFTRRAQNRMAMYSWPGNVRELENVIGNACIMVEGSVIDIRDLPEPVRGQARETLAEEDTLLPLREMQRRHITRVLDHVGGNKSQAAEILGISRATIYELIADMKKSGSHDL